MFRMIHDLMSPVLSDRTILKHNRKGQLIETPLKMEQVQPNSIDLTLADGWKEIDLGNGYVIDPAKPVRYRSGKFQKHFESDKDLPPYHIVEPKKFVLMASNEILNIPNGIIAFVQGRSSIARLAIQTEQAGLIDARLHSKYLISLIIRSNCTKTCALHRSISSKHNMRIVSMVKNMDRSTMGKSTQRSR